MAKIQLSMTGIARDGALPLDPFQPNAATLQAIKDAETGQVEHTTLEGLRGMIRDDQAELRKPVK